MNKILKNKFRLILIKYLKKSLNKLKTIEATKRALNEQHREQEDRKLQGIFTLKCLDFWDKKQYTKTHFGPEEGEELKQIYKVKREKEKEMLDKELKQQIAIKQQFKAVDKSLGKQSDQVVIDQNKALLNIEEKEAKLKKKLQQQKNVKAWSEQQAYKVS